MQNTTPMPVPNDDSQMSADGTGTFTFITEEPSPKEWLPSGRTSWASPAETIVDAVRAGDLAKVASLVADASYSPVNYLELALTAAVIADKLEIGRYLLDHGAKMDRPAKPIIRILPGSYAASEQSLPFLKLFIEHGWDINFTDCNRTALCFFIQDIEAVTWLLAHGADPNLGHPETSILSNGGHLLDLAALCSTVEVFDALIAHGARLEDSLALHHAAAARARGPLGDNDTRIMARLLELGVDINEPDDKGKPKNGSIGAPIYWAIRRGQIANLKFLVENGADLTVEAPYNGGTPLEKARARGSIEIVKYLESVSPI
ncbi:hypothetical protein VE03_04244 [Pseudogymnoascus sp. 23342-1-I1]|nr:hypothetical protein VE03_04244 [Pseudogymnoascus sp. 23342-1-I1]